MIEKLINNFTLMTSFIFFGNMLRSTFIVRLPLYSKARHSIEGILLGLFGILLMHYTFPVTPSVFADFRLVAILVSVCLGGWYGGLWTTAIAGIYRLIFLHGLSYESILAAAGIVATYIASLFIIPQGKLKLRTWSIALGVSLACIQVVFLLTLQDYYLETMMKYAVIYLAGGMLTYFMMNYMSRSDHLLRMMKEAASLDFLTGLHNSRSFDALFQERAKRGFREQRPFSLLVADIDHFKKVNDTYGHPAGDCVLKQLAEILHDSFRPGDQIARKGGEEFVIIVECGPDKIGHVAEKLRVNVEGHSFVLPDGTSISCSISVGGATYPLFPPEELFDRADQALYEAKNTGRNKVCIASL
ncbi:GGDEF domain-containing protein [Paenibacillus sp. CAA11]|uniref:GGDEF domain-containing protein n=1 Tax=Paenibacillus sp. CAA11 TaxID=1532905 RepID=UPI000D36586B|nr:diguanylate cyclase [Paenibacillus sp. CAA11]AWB43593.1 GGDEF domain-containing protein [Paenibacillus sp. CAA11]